LLCRQERQKAFSEEAAGTTSPNLNLGDFSKLRGFLLADVGLPTAT